MTTKDFLGGILHTDMVPRVLNFQSGNPVQVISLNADEIASYIGSLHKYDRLLLKLRINRRSREADYAADHVSGLRKEDIQKRILLSEFWGMLAKIAAPHFKK